MTDRSSYNGSWHGGKGSRYRKVDEQKYDTNFTRAFGTKLTWLQKKRVKEIITEMFTNV